MRGKLAASFALVAEAAIAVVQKKTALICGTFLPVVGILLVTALSAEIPPSLFSRISLVLVVLPFYALFATVVHRVVLLGEDSLPNRWGMFWTNRETRFTGWLIGIWFLYFALSLPTGIIYLGLSGVFAGWNVYWIGTILSYMVVAYFEGRFSLVLPATAIDKRSNFRDSWAMSRGKGIIIAVALVLPAMILIPIESVMYGAIDESLSPIADLFLVLLIFPIFAVEIAIVSLAYDKLAH